MKKFGTIILVIALMFSLVPSVFAFSDIKGVPSEKEILDLKERGIIRGVSENKFAPKKTVTNAEAVTMLVRTFDLNLDLLNFVKKPKASDIFKNIRDDRWYSQNFIMAYHNGLTLSTDIGPLDDVTREQFAHMLLSTLTNQYDLAFIMLWNIIEDEEDIDSTYMGSIQNLLNANITTLENGHFRPKEKITRLEAAQMIHRTILLIEDLANREIE